MRNCLGPEDLAGYADGTVQGPAREAIESRLALCRTCRAEVRGLIEALEASGPGAPRRLAEVILNGVRSKEGRPMKLRYVAALAAAVLVGIAVWLATRPDRPEQVPIVVREPQPPVPVPRDLGGSERFLGHLSTDKPLYRPGERVHARVVLLDAFDRKPAAKPVWTMFEVRPSRGEIVAQGQSVTDQGVAPFGWEIPQGQAGGVYTLLAKFPGEGYPDAEMTFDVRSYRVPRLRTDLQFLKKAYGPGEEVVAALSATRAEGGIPAGARVTAVATVDGAEVHRGTLALDARGAGGVTFRLPTEIAVGNGTLSMIVEDGGVQETAAKSIPIVVNRVAVSFYPEGGDLIAGLETRVYFEARTPKQDPADVAGRIVDDAGKEVARFESVHEGRGRFGFKPVAGRRYRALIDRPSGVKDAFPLPEVYASGFSLATLEDAGKLVRVRVASSDATAAMVGLFVRERELVRKAVALEAGKSAELALDPGLADGVLRVTIFDGEGRPRAERIVFRAPERSLRIALKVDPEKTVPTGKVDVTVRTTDATGKPVAAVVGLSAVDDAVLETIDPRERAPRLPVQALLGAEVRELRDAHVYLGSDPQAALKTDLLLGTQGWRRFAFVDPSKFLAAHGSAARRALAQIQVAVAMGLEDEGAGEALPAVEAPPPPRQAQPGGGLDFILGMEPAAERAEGVITAAWARVYAHEVMPGKSPGERTDFTETVFWHAGLATNEKGEATFSFRVSDSITTFRLRADGFGEDGALGEAARAVEVRRPFYVEPKFPLEVTAGDRIDLPVSLVNGTDSGMTAELETSVGRGLRLLEARTWKGDIAAAKSARTLLPLTVEPHQGEVELRLRAQGGPHRDDVTRKIAVVPAGFPIEASHGGLLEVVVRHEVAIPGEIEPGSLVTQAAVYPSPLASLTQALAALLQEPYGCFEQTSSTNYPNIMALQYMKSHSGVDPALVRRAQELAEKGYKCLVSFECRQKGYEWFGHDPGHEALTAYGVLEFVDMSRVMQVDLEMVERTRRWLLSRRDGNGGFLRDPKALDSFGGAPEDITNAYILWALTEAGEKGLEKEIETLKKVVASSDDPYHLALAANVLLNVGDRPAAEGVLERLAKKQAPSGAIPGARTSVTRSGGESLDIETVSLAIQGWLRFPKHTAHSEKAMRWLTERCRSGRFGATQSTILALRAIVAYDAAHARARQAGKVVLRADGKSVSEAAFPASQEGPIVLGDFAAALAPGKHVLELAMEGGAHMPYSLQIKYHARTPASSDQCKVGLRTALSRAEVAEGEAVDAAVEVANRTEEGLPMATAIVGLPGGLEARADQLKELVREGKVDAFETRGREVILYWRAMAPGAKKSLTLSCLAAVPGEYAGPASRAYLYYTDEHKDWKPGLRVRISRR